MLAPLLSSEVSEDRDIASPNARVTMDPLSLVLHVCSSGRGDFGLLFDGRDLPSHLQHRRTVTVAVGGILLVRKLEKIRHVLRHIYAKWRDIYVNDVTLIFFPLLNINYTY